MYLFKYRARGSVDPEGRLLKSGRKKKRNHSFAPGGLLALHSAALARRLNAYCDEPVKRIIRICGKRHAEQLGHGRRTIFP